MYRGYLSTSCSTSNFRVIARECFKMSADDIDKNERMVRFMPELKSPFAKYPLQAEAWLDIHTTINNEDGSKTPAFIPHKADPDCPMPDIRDDYVWGAGPLSYGYYHILTRNAYAILISRIRKKGRPIQYCCFGSLTQAAKDYDVVSEIIYNRSVATRPDDIQAAADALDKASTFVGLFL